MRGKSLERVKNLLLTLKINPLPVKEFDIKKIKNVSDTYRVRISRYRIIYKIRWDSKEIYVIEIALRDEKTYK